MDKKNEQLMNIEIATLSAFNARVLFIALGILQALQLTLYFLNTESELHNTWIMISKAIIIALILIFLPILNMIIAKKPFFNKNSELFLAGILLITLLWSILNTFFAQVITSDISVYVLVMFSSVAVIRLRPRIFVPIFLFSYFLFAVGISGFQENINYLRSHQMNGLILTIVAILILSIFYKNAVVEYNDRKDIEVKNIELLFLSQHDGLTKLYNHKTIHELLDESIKLALQNNTLLFLMIFDLDYFKEVNDLYGHKTGDEVLVFVSEKLEEIALDSFKIGRYGGDEFLIIMPETDIQTVIDFTNKLSKAISTVKISENRMTLSAGIAKWENENAQQLVEKADKNLYISKNKGRDQYTYIETGGTQ